MLDDLFRKGTEAARKVVRDATSETDPTTYSSLQSQSPLEEVGRASDIYHYKLVQNNEGEEYVRLSKPEDRPVVVEQLVSRLLKGIVNVSDVIAEPTESGKPVYYSRVMPLEKIRDEAATGEFEVDRLILGFVFNDWDHKLMPEHSYAQNLNIADNKFTHYDFGNARFFFDSKYNSFWRDDAARNLPTLAPGTRLLLKAKLQQLKERVSGGEGLKFLDAIVRDTGVPLAQMFEVADTDEITTRVFQHEIVARIDSWLQALEGFEHENLEAA